MKYIVFLICPFLLIPASPSMAASQDECAIWLCLPSGFPAGCSAAKSAFKKRILKRKPPLPSFSSCAVNADNMSYKIGKAYLQLQDHCVSTGDNPVSIAEQMKCRMTWTFDTKCKYTYCKVRDYIQILDNGNPIGSNHILDY